MPESIAVELVVKGASVLGISVGVAALRMIVLGVMEVAYVISELALGAVRLRTHLSRNCR